MKTGEVRKGIFDVWADSYTAVAKMWEDTYVNLYKPWIESTGELVERAAELPKEAEPEKYREFYDEWMRMYQNTFGRLYPIPTRVPDREALERLAASAEDLGNLFRSWATELEENTKKTGELLMGEPDPEKYRMSYDMWMRSYGKILDDFLALPARESTREIFESYTGMPNIYLRNFAQVSKLWRDTYRDIYWPMVDSMMRLTGRMTEISRGGASPEAYREFYNQWMDMYRETYSGLFNVQAMRPSREMLDNFLQSTDIYLNMYKSWMTALEKMSERTMDLSRRTADPEAVREFYSTWTKMYERAFDDFFKNMPMMGPMRQMMEPVKNSARIYADTFASMANMWMRPPPSPASRV